MTTTEYAGVRRNSDGGSEYSWRDALPASMISKSELSIWSVLKKCIGKDLTRISIPVVFNEPLSFLQRLAEYMEYAELLEKANKCTDAVERFEYVAAFIVSSLSCNYMRLSKPFNPLWFETYELDRSEKSNYRFIAEQVSHHPPKSALHAESKSYEFDGVVSPRLKFWGTCIEVQPSGTFQLKLLNYSEIYTWKALNVTVHNIVMGQMEKILRAIYGNWTAFLATCDITNFEFRYNNWLEIGKQFFQNCSIPKDIPLIQGSKLIWKNHPRPSNSSAMYNFTSFTFLLNDPSGITDLLPPTDSRRRPDIRLLEAGQAEAAEKEKERLEIKQRQARALMRYTKEKLPKWFKKVNIISKDQLSWIFTYKYWNREYCDCEDIY
ncbi:Oxysterol-binding protein [Onchocerca flexuosa]|uniref:Oxysterol-binding protein n=1 Tax=Onchocerca flexuosa TaxID=387005 RepID=A0A238BU50_9BILA|nr:Oxysterol-binding protein [Onchocerca flexuosa]